MLWRTNVRKVVPYTPGEQPTYKDIIKLNTNENPYPPSVKVQEAIREFDGSYLRKYPDPMCRELVTAISDAYKVKPSQVFVGVGSDDVLAMSFMTFFGSDKPVLFPDVTYSFYDVWAELFHIPYKKVRLDSEFKISPCDYIGRPNGGIVFPNPNAPTGIELPASDVEEIIRSNPDSVVIVDEAYVDFGATSALPLIEKYDNLLVVQTFSKARSLAGLRVGFAFGNSELISYLWDVRNSYNSYTLSGVAIRAASASLADKPYFRETITKIVSTRECAKESFSRLGFEVLESKANFLFIKHPDVPAEQLFGELKENRIFVRYFNSERTREYLRVTVGTDEEMEALFDFLNNRLNRWRG